jgi:hypothetical protein
MHESAPHVLRMELSKRGALFIVECALRRGNFSDLDLRGVGDGFVGGGHGDNWLQGDLENSASDSGNTELYSVPR